MPVRYKNPLKKAVRQSGHNPLPETPQRITWVAWAKRLFPVLYFFLLKLLDFSFDCFTFFELSF